MNGRFYRIYDLNPHNIYVLYYYISTIQVSSMIKKYNCTFPTCGLLVVASTCYIAVEMSTFT